MQDKMNADIVIDTKKQTLTFYGQNPVSYLVSTAKNGTGQLMGSYCTPLGLHKIAQKIGDNAPMNCVFVGRVPTGEIYDTALAQQHPDRDWILTRILWLEGCETGINQGQTAQGECCDSYQRYIYIHGTPDSEPMGEPRSHGCVRMHNADIVALFERVCVGMSVLIV